MRILKAGVYGPEEMKRMDTVDVIRVERGLAARKPRVWFPSTETFARVLSAKNRRLLRAIAERTPRSLGQLADLTGRTKGNLSRTLKTMAQYGLVRMEPGSGGRKEPKVNYDGIVLELRFVGKRRVP